MQTTSYFDKFRKQRKLLLIMPLLILPIITLLFWTIGGEKYNDVIDPDKNKSGLNTKLPDATIKNDKNLDKLSFYQQASKDSAKSLEEKRNDPYWLQFNKKDSAFTSPGINPLSANQELYNPLPDNASDIDVNEAKVYSKLNQLNKALANTKQSANQRELSTSQYARVNASLNKDRVNQLEAMMGRIKEDKTADPEIAQLNQMLDKIAAIQHPDLVTDTALQFNQDKSIKEHALMVYKKDKRVPVSTLQASTAANATTITQIDFLGESSSLTIMDTIDANAFGAMIAETQTVVSGATVKLSLMQDVTVSGKSLPKGSLLYGSAALKNERLIIHINSIRFGNNILPVSLNVYDLDGLEGIYVPGSIGISAAKGSADRAASGIEIPLFASSIGAQAAGAGIETVKTILGKKIKLVKIILPAGYQVLLKDSHFNQ